MASPRSIRRSPGDGPLDEDQSPKIFIFFKHVDPPSMADPGPQLEKVLAFRKSLEDSRKVL